VKVTCVDRIVLCVAFRQVFIVFLQSVMVVTVSMDMSTVTVSVRITVNALKKVPPNVLQVSRHLVCKITKRYHIW